MDVTIDNFEQILPEIKQKIEECTFCSIDCELTGITQYKNLNSFDTPRIRYEKIKNNDNNFLILQFGLCLFKYNEGDKSYETNAYNCYLFPRSVNCKYSRDLSFSCLNSSLEFLIEQNFDFNKVFKKGVSFVSKDQEEILRHKLELDLEERSIPKGTLYPSKKEFHQQIDTLMTEIDEFVQNENETRKEIKFTEFVVRIFIEKNIRQKYQKRLKYENKFLENKERLMTITKVDSLDIKSDLDDFEKEIGFSRLIWFLSQSQKLIIGHNMMTDVMQILRQFFTSPLPENFEDFKSMTNSLFPKILDTKYMASVPPLKELVTNTTLGDMDKILSKDPFPTIKIENDVYSVNDEKLHEAGYDAYLTGCCYARMMHYLESLKGSRSTFEEFYINRLYLMKSFDTIYIDLKNFQEEPKRDNVFYLEFPSSWETQDLYDLFSAYGPIFIGWINDRSAFVGLQNADNAKKAAGQLVGVSGREYKVYFYSTFINQKNKSALGEKKENGKNKQIDKRKRNKGGTNQGAETTSDESSELKKVKTEENGSVNIEKPFEQNADW
ncbi:poly(A)-specific ribonuclease PARN isoform X1 [Brachionus plicatilis]|uniref:Poly(A)-specific ribonuclease PARN isoform X1 n=1 Tax=Brachionus plicatilis TaxID=10195 RepID=A0A3M7QTX5_BRAPC|nr:poly(A)-specific ribonuclease PARN isoform X1 [Brachionus plicatilis]